MVANVKKILINIQNNKILFSYKTNNSSINNDLINTNIISNNELIFSDIYIKENTKILTSFLKELTIQYNINEVVVSKIELASLIIPLISKSSLITSIYFKEDEPLSYTICEELINIKNIKNINCYTIQPFMIELLDKNSITCDTRSEILYMSNFMNLNNLLRYSNIYYKTNIRLPSPLTFDDLKDLESFFKINKYLKTIHLDTLNRKELEYLINFLIKHNRHNLKIVIHENINDEKTITYLKDLNKKYKRKYHLVLALEYSKEYLNNNIFKQTIINTLKVCGLIISSLVILIVTYIGVSNYIALKQVTAIKKDLAKVIETTDAMEIINKKNEENKQKMEEQTENIPPNEPTTPEPSEPSNPEPTNPNPYKLISNIDLATLLTVNEDVVGELKVNNTNVDYPVVQAKDNDYYLNHNINKEKNANGWIFMDYRNNSMNLDKNTIVYGHNMYYSGVMFGTLHKTANSSWYTNPENQIITFNTLYENMQFKIFSIYRVPKTNDYLRAFFTGDEDFLSFIDLIQKRSIYNFNVNVLPTDKILTLSTCSNNGTKRLVIHAVLIEKPSN